MSELSDLKEPWLVAAWPGMGGVAQIAASYLVHALDAEHVAEIPPNGFFEIQAITVVKGLVQDVSRPRSRLLAWKSPAWSRDLLFFLGDKQPTWNGYGFCEKLLDVAHTFDVTRVVTFAAMATAIHPSADPRVLAVATDGELLKELHRTDVEFLAEGKIGGMNGVLLAAAAARGLPGLSLLGEFPYFASAVPNPKASAAVLRVFTDMAELEVGLKPLHLQGELAEESLLELLKELQESAGVPTTAPESVVPTPLDAVDPEVEARIEGLFRRAQDDRSKAHELKAELDSQGLFKRYEDRFLDLFRKVE